MIRLIATDLDNTLLDEGGQIPPGTVRLLRDTARKGVHIAVATGRCYPSALAAARAVGAQTPVICYNGSRILRGEQVLFARDISVAEIRRVSRFCHEQGLYLQCYDPDHVLVIEEMCDSARVDPDLPRVGCREVGDLRLYAGLNPTPKMLIVEAPGKVAARIAQLERHFPDLSFCQSQPWLIEVMPPDAGKGPALMRLAALLGVAREEVMALGDNTNDLSMLRWAGVAATVSNAVDAVKEIADFVSDLPRSQGVEQAIRHYLP